MKAALRRKLFVIGIIVVVVSATIYGFLPKPVEVDLVAVSRGPLQVTIEEEGRTRLKDRFVISAPTAGYLRRIEAKVGDPVRKGQTVATLEPVRSQALDPRSRAETEAAVLAAQAGLAAAMEKAKAATADADYIEKRAAQDRQSVREGLRRQRSVRPDPGRTEEGTVGAGRGQSRRRRRPRRARTDQKHPAELSRSRQRGRAGTPCTSPPRSAAPFSGSTGKAKGPSAWEIR